ncbi:MAG: rod-binding protein [Lachnospiraceae bacterium]|nr:rod-binding protein [Lachnospiraceae bacterium]MBP3610487.1 rod-binding protein [Lachnospiraceae bacterium]
MAISIGSNSILMQQNAANAASAKAEKLSSSLSGIENGTATDEELMEACKEFESYLVEQVIKSTKKAMLRDEDSQGDYMKMFGDTLTQSYAEMITESADLGIAQMLYESMKRN